MWRRDDEVSRADLFFFELRVWCIGRSFSVFMILQSAFILYVLFLIASFNFYEKSPLIITLISSTVIFVLM